MLIKTNERYLESEVNKVNDLYFSKDTKSFWKSKIVEAYRNTKSNLFIAREKTIMPSGEPYYFNKIFLIADGKLEVDTVDFSFLDLYNAVDSFGHREQEVTEHMVSINNNWNSSLNCWIMDITDKYNNSISLNLKSSDRFVCN